MMLWCKVGFTHLTAEVCCSQVIGIPTTSGICYMYFSTSADRQSLHGENLGVTLYLNASAAEEPGNIFLCSLQKLNMGVS